MKSGLYVNVVLKLVFAGLACGTALAQDPVSSGRADSQTPQSYQFQIGDFDCTVVDEGTLDGVTASFLFANAPPDLLKERMAAYGLNPEQIVTHLSCLLVNTGDDLILIDTGLGSFANEWPSARRTGKLLPTLADMGVKPEDIDVVVLSHHHGDHIGGSSTEGKPTFPNARYFMWKSEWEFSLSQDDWRRDVLIPIEKQVVLLEKDTEIVPGIVAMEARGHTIGHLIVSVSSKEEEMLCVGDIICHPLHVEYPDWHMSHEFDVTQVARTRRKFLDSATQGKTLVHASHIGTGYVIATEKGWKWQPTRTAK